MKWLDDLKRLFDTISVNFSLHPVEQCYKVFQCRGRLFQSKSLLNEMVLMVELHNSMSRFSPEVFLFFFAHEKTFYSFFSFNYYHY